LVLSIAGIAARWIGEEHCNRVHRHSVPLKAARLLVCAQCHATLNQLPKANPILVGVQIVISGVATLVSHIHFVNGHSRAHENSLDASPPIVALPVDALVQRGLAAIVLWGRIRTTTLKQLHCTLIPPITGCKVKCRPTE